MAGPHAHGAFILIEETDDKQMIMENISKQDCGCDGRYKSTWCPIPTLGVRLAVTMYQKLSPFIQSLMYSLFPEHQVLWPGWEGSSHPAGDREHSDALSDTRHLLYFGHFIDFIPHSSLGVVIIPDAQAGKRLSRRPQDAFFESWCSPVCFE